MTKKKVVVTLGWKDYLENTLNSLRGKRDELADQVREIDDHIAEIEEAIETIEFNIEEAEGL